MKNTKAIEWLEAAHSELKDCIEHCEPHVPENGKKMDPFHAGCCALRALNAVLSAKEELTNDEEK